MVSSAFNCLACAFGAELSGSFIDRLPLCTILRHRVEIANPRKMECRTELQERALWRPPVYLPPTPRHQRLQVAPAGSGRHSYPASALRLPAPAPPSAIAGNAHIFGKSS
jgi:hypothetical protein